MQETIVYWFPALLECIICRASTTLSAGDNHLGRF